MSKHKQERIQSQEPPIEVQEVPPLDGWGEDFESATIVKLPVGASIVDTDPLRAEQQRLADAMRRRGQLAVDLDAANKDAEASRTRIAELQQRTKPDVRHWPKDKPLPTYWVKRSSPCPKCLRLLTDEGGQASVVTSSGDTVVFFRCKCCGHRWQLPVKGA